LGRRLPLSTTVGDQRNGLYIYAAIYGGGGDGGTPSACQLAVDATKIGVDVRTEG
jgi:hypothetical protein